MVGICSSPRQLRRSSARSTMMGSAAAGPYCKNLDRALRELDHHTH
jgi:hypothetical protein